MAIVAISERQSMAIVAKSERQSMAIVKQPRRTFAGERQAEAFIARSRRPPGGETAPHREVGRKGVAWRAKPLRSSLYNTSDSRGRDDGPPETKAPESESPLRGRSEGGLSTLHRSASVVQRVRPSAYGRPDPQDSRRDEGMSPRARLQW